MPSGQYILDGTCYNTDETTALSEVSVSCYNATTNEEQTMLTNTSGQYIFNLANFSNGYHNGDEISLFTSSGRNYKEKTTTVNTDNISETNNLTLDSTYSTTLLYCSVDEVRKYTGIHSTAEWSDDALHKIITQVTRDIDVKTGRTWKGIQTVSNELYDGNDQDILWLNHTDLQAISALAIDDDRNGTYTTVSISSGSVTWVPLYTEGYIVLDTTKAVQVASFTSGANTVKVSYTWGNAAPTSDIRRLAILTVANSIKPDRVRQTQIDEIIKNIKWYRWHLA